jgi:serine/threonine protein phosphatase 1
MPAAAPTVPANTRLYVIGDIHGRADLLEQLNARIEQDSQTAGKAAIRRIFLGDYVDRGLSSRQVIESLIALKAKEKTPPVFLLGNHEQVMRTLLQQPENEDLMQNWLRFGGRETLLSYGVRAPLAGGKSSDIIAELIARMPPSHIKFLESLTLSATYGDYFFCHAGVRPGVDLKAQNEQDLIWIRYDFLDHKKPFGKVVVHGHTICRQVEFKPNRIDIDTGAYATGCLTALGLEGTKQWLLQTA